ncbi:ATP synthase F1 subunit gamma [uncultured Parolsenella sp.]|uniref:ATP synthase F1 subunit gamma n=1 Tax=uncultured Parolsenella sp. TaxID=2083008 RepID=UPI0028049E95|nr:ATP synthase F1 subunit gamma [uncultured Parolsenella sp.]
MSNLREIQRRISSVKATSQITRTMEMVSTAKIRKALERAEEAEPYKDAISRMMGAVVGASLDERQPLLAKHAEVKNVLFIVVASDRGLAGGFNVQPQRDVQRKMDALKAKGVASQLITSGRKPTDYFTYRGVEPVISFTGTSSEPTMDQADQIATYVMDSYAKGSIDRVELVYWHAKNRVEQTLVNEQLLPINPDAFKMPNEPRNPEAMSTLEHDLNSPFEFEPSASEVLGYLIPAYVRTVIFHAMLDSAAAEHGARRRAMHSATENAEDVITNLSRTYNRVRQGSITTELNEIIGGASALEDN